MRAVSTNFLDALRGSHSMVSRVLVLTEFQTGTQPTGTEIEIIDGEVSSDSSADVRMSCGITTNGLRKFPLATSSLLTPYGNELFIQRGIDFGNGLVELVSLGYFKMDSVEQDQGPDGPLRITAYDRMKSIVEARLTQPVSFVPGTTLGTIYTQLITEVYPDAVIEYDDASYPNIPLTTLQTAEENRYEFLLDITTSRGKIMYWDYRGIFVVRNIPNPLAPVYDVNYGTSGVLIKMRRKLLRDGVYNAVVASGENTDETEPVRSIVYDNNSISPTYYWGKYGKVPKFYTSPFINTIDQARGAAQSILNKSMGLPQEVDLTTIPNPALEVLDPVRFVHRDGIAIHIIESMRMGLEAKGELTLNTRKQVDLQLGDIL